MLSGKMCFAFFPALVQNVVFLPLFACISINPSVEYECIYNVDDLLRVVRLLTSFGIGAAILYLFENVFYGAAGVILFAHSSIICHQINW
jgi:hypothetical protein